MTYQGPCYSPSRGGTQEKFYSLLSGGKDSMSVTHWLSQRDMLAGVVVLDTGISVPEWHEFIQRVTEQYQWPCEFFRTSASYDALVLKYGFPGPGAHWFIMAGLKGRGIRAFKKLHKGAMLASGARKGESKRRGRVVSEWNRWEGVTVWNPLWEWTTEEVWAYMREHNLPRSPCYATLGISGDCLCGAFATRGEREIIRTVYPEIDIRLSELEKHTEKPWGWANDSLAKSKTKGEMLICAECDPSGLPESGTR